MTMPNVEMPLGLSVEPLASRAKRWHQSHMSTMCLCVARGKYPCHSCHAEIVSLVELLDTVARDVLELRRKRL